MARTVQFPLKTLVGLSVVHAVILSNPGVQSLAVPSEGLGEPFQHLLMFAGGSGRSVQPPPAPPVASMPLLAAPLPQASTLSSGPASSLPALARPV